MQGGVVREPANYQVLFKSREAMKLVNSTSTVPAVSFLASKRDLRKTFSVAAAVASTSKRTPTTAY